MNEIIKVHSHFHPDDRRMMLRFFDQVLIREASHLRRDVRILREDGTYTWTRVNVMVRDFRPEDGIIDMVCVNYDITNGNGRYEGPQAVHGYCAGEYGVASSAYFRYS